jgi:hypothetical protein
MIAMQELVVPKSMPKIFAIFPLLCRMWAESINILQDINYK